MTPAVRDGAIIAGACVLGALASLLFGTSPAAVTPQPGADTDWTPVGMRVPDFERVDAIWVARAPWGALPVPVEPEEPPPPPPPPPPVPVGVVGAGRNVQAIFLVHGEGGVQVRVGGRLPDGGQLVRVNGMTIHWIDGDGQARERRLFLDPQTQSPDPVP